MIKLKEVFELGMHLNLCSGEMTYEDLYIPCSALRFGNCLIMSVTFFFPPIHNHTSKTSFPYEHDRVSLEVE